MTTRDHLIYHMQDLYSFERDMIPLLLEMRSECNDDHIQQLLQDEGDAMRSEMDTIERGLNLLSTFFRQERNPLVPALKDAYQRFKRQTNPPAEQRDIYSALALFKAQHSCIAAYQGLIEMARAIGEQDVAMLMSENQQRQQRRSDSVQQYIPSLVSGTNRGESRQAA
ncbi:MAG TPA: DUF892 family protein [Armatimonadota bacterium]|nr:DUF892 family protein [Armatimonadota bacterium]